MAKWSKKWKVRSFTDQSKEYVVSEGTDMVLGEWATVMGCACAAWRFKKIDPRTGRRPDCKHIQATLALRERERLEKLTLEKEQLSEEYALLLSQWEVEEVMVLPKLGMREVDRREDDDMKTLPRLGWQDRGDREE